MQVVKNMKFFLQVIALQILLLTSVRAQEPHVHGKFQSDSIRTGEIVPFTLTAHYPSTKQLIFPDTTFSFSPFEISDKKFFTTITSQGISRDSVVYFLTTFETDSIQWLRLPVFVADASDCVAVYANLDSIFFNPRVGAAPDSVSIEKLPLKSNTDYKKVKWILNYPILLGIVLGVLIVLAIVWIAFGKRIRKYFAIRILKKEYAEFMAHFAEAINHIGSGFSSQKAEHALIVWKKYMEGLEHYPYTKSTSREIARRVADRDLVDALGSIDRGIYGGVESTTQPYEFLQAYSHQRFQKKEEEVKNG